MTKAGKYTFQEQKAIGDLAEDTVEKYLSEMVKVEKVDSLKEQLKGIDFILDLEGDKKKVEVKIDNICHRNGRYFLEIELVKANGQHSKDGWVHTTASDFLFLLVGRTNTLRIVKPEEIRKNLVRWRRAYGIRECYNKSGYSSIGVCVPFVYIKGLTVDLASDCEQTVIDFLKNN